MPKIFYTERDIDDMKARGITSIDVTDNVVLTDLALERAMRYEMKINRIKQSAPAYSLNKRGIQFLQSLPEKISHCFSVGRHVLIFQHG